MDSEIYFALGQTNAVQQQQQQHPKQYLKDARTCICYHAFNLTHIICALLQQTVPIKRVFREFFFSFFVVVVVVVVAVLLLFWFWLEKFFSFVLDASE